MCPPTTRSHGFGQESLSLGSFGVLSRLSHPVASVCLTGMPGWAACWQFRWVSVWLAGMISGGMNLCCQCCTPSRGRVWHCETSNAGSLPAQRNTKRKPPTETRISPAKSVDPGCSVYLFTQCLFIHRKSKYVCMLCTQVPKASYSSFFFYYDLHGFTSCLLVCRCVCVFHDNFIHFFVST